MKKQLLAIAALLIISLVAFVNAASIFTLAGTARFEDETGLKPLLLAIDSNNAALNLALTNGTATGTVMAVNGTFTGQVTANALTGATAVISGALTASAITSTAGSVSAQYSTTGTVSALRLIGSSRIGFNTASNYFALVTTTLVFVCDGNTNIVDADILH